MRSRLFAIILTVPLAGCALFDDLQYGPGRFKSHDHGGVQTYPLAVAEAPPPVTETARPAPGSVAPLPRHRVRSAPARAPRPVVTTPPPDGVSAPLPAPVEAQPVVRPEEVQPPPPPKEPVADAPKAGKGKHVRPKKCRAPGGWAIWRQKCQPPPTDG